MTKEELVLRGTTAYFEAVESPAATRMKDGGIVFLNMPLPVGCNYSCPKCFSGGSDIYNADLNKRDVSSKFIESERKNLITEAHNLGAETLVIAGAGEPLLYPHLDNLLEYTGSLGMNSIVFTNGIYLSEKRARHFFDSGTSVVFSYDSTNLNTYDVLTGTRGNHAIARSNLEKALTLSRTYSTKKEGIKIVPLAINTNLTTLTFNSEKGIDEVAEIRKLISNDAMHFVSNITPTGNARENWKLLVGTDDFSPDESLMNAAQKYSGGSGGSGRKQDGDCAYLHNGVVAYEGHYMMCPNFGLKQDFGRYPEVSVLEHFKEKKEFLSEKHNPACVTRK